MLMLKMTAERQMSKTVPLAAFHRVFCASQLLLVCRKAAFFVLFSKSATASMRRHNRQEFRGLRSTYARQTLTTTLFSTG